MKNDAPAITAFGVCYPSIAAAARAHGLSPEAVTTRMRRGNASVERAIALLRRHVSVFGKTCPDVGAALGCTERNR